MARRPQPPKPVYRKRNDIHLYLDVVSHATEGHDVIETINAMYEATRAELAHDEVRILLTRAEQQGDLIKLPKSDRYIDPTTYRLVANLFYVKPWIPDLLEEVNHRREANLTEAAVEEIEDMEVEKGTIVRLSYVRVLHMSTYRLIRDRWAETRNLYRSHDIVEEVRRAQGVDITINDIVEVAAIESAE
ncbi:hypothetical protein UCRPC4_g04775 [Phaeomoniella chlamydospora]|uniref:Uncharacterized protein n=1 Tax=Phaeomoniella chlamydospora TaxID=158046 RepID=A0A0G2GPP7_PHACM|nr:hypothetical protein UCRPC4_g04775 [Phaeomoniella chlamydospora]